MKIVNITQERDRISAQIIWEDSRKRAQEIYFATDPEYGADLTTSPHPFLTAAICPAFFSGEKRVLVEGAICPMLRINLITAVQILARWYAPDRQEGIAIEATEGFKPTIPPLSQRAGMFLSGGVDSLVMLRENRMNFPLDHPLSIGDGFFVYGFDIGNPDQSERTVFYERAKEKLETLTEEMGVNLIPVRTNLRILEKRCCSWPAHFFGLGTASIAHAFEGRLATIYIASGKDIGSLVHNGSHPMLDQYFSSGGLRFIHSGAHLTRLEKVSIISNWPEALQVLRVCFLDISSHGPMNCGKCLKCVGTMLGLLAHGKLDQATTFPRNTIVPRDIKTIINTKMPRYFSVLVGMLEDIGRPDLARAVEEQIKEYGCMTTQPDRAWWSPSGNFRKIKGLFSGPG